MDELSKLELVLLQKLGEKYPYLKKHFKYLKVRDRVFTGIGMYINFIYTEEIEMIDKLEISDTSLSTNENIEVDGLKYGLGYELDISNGRMNYIEFITYGETWDGTFKNFRFVS